MRAQSIDLQRRARDGVTPETAGWSYLSFRELIVGQGGQFAGETKGEETALVWLGGRAEVDGFGTVGERADVWEGKPWTILLPPETAYRGRAVTDCIIGVVSAPADDRTGPRLVSPDQVGVENRGRGVTERRIHWILPERDPAARLILVEVFTPAGHWSTYPPHKHDHDDPPRERALEELYYYRIRPEQGFALQGIYTKDGDLDVTVRARHEDLVLVPRGYHVVSAAPGYECYYLNAMAGAVREWLFTTDPDHQWLMDWKKA